MATTLSRQSPTDTAEYVTDALAPLTEQDVAAQTSATSFKRGHAYARLGHILRAVRRENMLRARCHGSSGGPYLVEATLAKADQTKKKRKNPATYSCDCPRGGFCKHVVALLLTWIRQPKTFAVRPPLANVLETRGRDEEWPPLIGELRQRFKTFRALQDELDVLGLR